MKYKQSKSPREPVANIFDIKRNRNMNTSLTKNAISLFAVLAMLPLHTWAFDSGVIGGDDFSPTVDTELQLPPDGILTFANINIPAGVTLRFTKNEANTPVTILASGNVTIDGVVDVSGGDSADVGTAGDGNVGDDGLPGIGGPGGFDGGQGGSPASLQISGANRSGAAGLGPGGGGGGVDVTLTSQSRNGLIGICREGGGGSFATPGSIQNSLFSAITRLDCRLTDDDRISAAPGAVYGSQSLLPLIGGSGGGGGGGDETFAGAGGGGGGGALLIAASGTVTIDGSILANGGATGEISGAAAGLDGGAGSGGAIRIIATEIAGNGVISAVSGRGVGFQGNSFGGDGRIRLEADTISFNSEAIPTFSFAAPQEIFVPGLPGLRITRVGGVDAPAVPTGNADIVLPADTPNPVTVEFESNGVPLGNVIQLTVTPSPGVPVSAFSNALSGNVASATASANIDLPEGSSTFSAQVSFTVTASIGDDMSRFAQGERVERVVLAAGLDGSSETVLITVSGKEYRYSGELPDLNGLKAAS